jgi:hypothetical protein
LYVARLLEFANAKGQGPDSPRYALDLADLAGLYSRNGLLATAAAVAATGGQGGPGAADRTAELIASMRPEYILGFGASLARGPTIDGHDIDRRALDAGLNRLIDSVPPVINVLIVLSVNLGPRAAAFAEGVLAGGAFLQDTYDPGIPVDRAREIGRLITLVQDPAGLALIGRLELSGLTLTLALLIRWRRWQHPYIRAIRRRRYSGTDTALDALDEDELEQAAGAAAPCRKLLPPN